MFRYVPSTPGQRPTRESTLPLLAGTGLPDPEGGGVAGLAEDDGLALGEAGCFTSGVLHADATTKVVARTIQSPKSRIPNRDDLLIMLMFIVLVRAIFSRWDDRPQTRGSFSRSSLLFGPANRDPRSRSSHPHFATESNNCRLITADERSGAANLHGIFG